MVNLSFKKISRLYLCHQSKWKQGYYLLQYQTFNIDDRRYLVIVVMKTQKSK
jgi:hypothetical protein